MNASFLSLRNRRMSVAARRAGVGSPPRSSDPSPSSQPKKAALNTMALAELLVLTAAVPLFGYALQKDDPFGVHAAFFWPLLAPLILSLRHGTLAGVASSITLDILFVADHYLHGRALAQLPVAVLVGMLALALLCGQFAEVSGRSLYRLETALSATTSQLAELSREHFLLELSHDRLEAGRGNDTPSLRDALGAIRRLSEASGPGDNSRVVDELMKLFASYCFVEEAALYPMQRGKLAREPAAVIGHAEPLPAGGDPMVDAALSSGQLVVAPKWEAPSANAKTAFVLAAPLLDAKGVVHGVVGVRSMPFIALDAKSLRTLAVMSGHAADLLSQIAGPGGYQRARRDELDAHIRRAIRDLNNGVPTTVLGMRLPRGNPLQDVAETVLRQSLRASDHLVLERDREQPLLAVVLAGADEHGARGLEKRIRQLAERELGAATEMPADCLSIHAVALGDSGSSILTRFRQRNPSHDARQATLGPV